MTPSPQVGSRGRLWMAIAIGLPLAILLGIGVVVVNHHTHNNGTTTTSQTTPRASSGTLPVAVEREMTSIPPSVYDTVGVTPPSSVTLTTPKVTTGQAILKSPTGMPEVFYMGAEFCPYCAATRWSLVAALSRFGMFSGLAPMASSPTDFAPSTPTVTFVGSTYKSSYLAFDPKEVQTVDHAPLQKLTPAETTIVKKDDTKGSFPFIDFGTRVVVQESAFDPLILDRQSRTTIASHLNDPTAVSTEAIVAAANYYSAGICSIDGQKPAAVCASPGVIKADHVLNVTP